MVSKITAANEQWCLGDDRVSAMFWCEISRSLMICSYVATRMKVAVLVLALAAAVPVSSLDGSLFLSGTMKREKS